MKYTLQELKQAAYGQWETIFLREAPELMAAIKADSKRGVPCPIHGGKDGLRLFKNWRETGGGVCNTCGYHADGISMIAWLRGSSMGQALGTVANAIRGSSDLSTVPIVHVTEQKGEKERTPEEIENAKQRISKILKYCRPISENSPASKYLQSRGLKFSTFEKASLMLHPGWFNEDVKYPTMVAKAISKDGAVVTTHNTSLTISGSKAPVEIVKKIMPPSQDMMGSAIRLFQPVEVLAVAEGIETSLAIRQAHGYPVWSAMAAPFLAGMHIPDRIKVLLIYADHDKEHKGKRAGQDAALKLKESLKDRGIDVRIFIPEEEGTDWLDVLLSKGPQAIPKFEG